MKKIENLKNDDIEVDFAKWLLLNRGIKEVTIKKYLGAIRTVENILNNNDHLTTKIFEISDPELIESFKNNKEVQEIDKRGNRMYTVPLNHYIKFLYYLKEINEESLDDQLNREVEDILMNNELRKPTLKKSKISTPTEMFVTKTNYYKRNPIKAANALILANFNCEISSEHKTFISRKTGENFVEAHHLIPMNQQKNYLEVNIDVEENIIALCPNCHRMIHGGKEFEVSTLLNDLWQMRNEGLINKGINISLDKLKKMYFIEE